MGQSVDTKARKVSTEVEHWGECLIKPSGWGFFRDLLGMEVKALWSAGGCSWQHWRRHRFGTDCSSVLPSPSDFQAPKALGWLMKLCYTTFLVLCSIISQWALNLVPCTGLFTFILNIFLKDFATHQFTPTLTDLEAHNRVISQQQVLHDATFSHSHLLWPWLIP